MRYVKTWYLIFNLNMPTHTASLVAMAAWSFHRFIMGKVKVGLYFYLTLGILTKVLQ